VILIPKVLDLSLGFIAPSSSRQLRAQIVSFDYAFRRSYNEKDAAAGWTTAPSIRPNHGAVGLGIAGSLL
jgi:hypothetical protein